ncbi:2-amino-4-hydroxy-6-hydroxymethyldihydropteridine diphosphokinase [Puteibacter caeruleilacunae]|nr:2-amino-4-hydroxy-6-hydroxymethyldihydropteridine diphosphokinase [Puteibacter caeruleilacunae]
MMNICIVAIGSNIKPEENIYKMLGILKEEQVVVKVSSFIRTEPIGIVDQPEFLNGAVKVKTMLEKDMFERYLKMLEDKLGRDRTVEKYGPRCIDLDIIVWNSEIIDDDYYERSFIQQTVDEIL